MPLCQAFFYLVLFFLLKSPLPYEFLRYSTVGLVLRLDQLLAGLRREGRGWEAIRLYLLSFSTLHA